jgi:hypothetical protein
VVNEINARKVKKAGKLLLPACAYARQNWPVKTQENDTLQILLRRETGVVPEFKLRCAEGERSPRCGQPIRNLVAELNPELDLDHLPPESRVVIPYQTHYQTIRLKPDVNAEDALDKVRFWGQGTLIARRASTPALVEPLGIDDIRDEVCKFAGDRTGQPWPFDASMLAHVLNRNIAATLKNKKRIKPTVVAVLDTGILGRGDFFSNKYFAVNLEEREKGPIRDRDHNGYMNDVIGINAALQGDVAADAGYEHNEHGSAVANLVLGGGPFRSLFGKLEKLVQIKIVKLVVRYKGQFAISETAIAAGLKYANRTKASVANISVGTQRKISEVLGFVKTPPGLVAVVAAGNMLAGDLPGRLDDFPTYPANFGGSIGEARDNVITVVAHDSAGKLAEFSRFGVHFADIAAPGCDLQFREKAPKLFGTSFAAPLVSFTVAMMRSFGFGQDEQTPLIKQRLQSSSDFDEKMSQEVAFSGRLNIVKALSLFDDVLEVRSTESTSSTTKSRLAFGRWSADDDTITLCKDGTNTDFRPDTIRKITPLNRGSQIRILYRARAENINETVCTPFSPGLDFLETDKPAKLKGLVAWSEIVDFVPGYYVR